MVLVIEHFILLLLQFKQFFLGIFPYYSQMISWLVVCYICSFVCSIGLAHYIARLLNVRHAAIYYAFGTHKYVSSSICETSTWNRLNKMCSGTLTTTILATFFLASFIHSPVVAEAVTATAAAAIENATKYYIENVVYIYLFDLFKFERLTIHPC